jgi:hypothetical protein
MAMANETGMEDAQRKFQETIAEPARRIAESGSTIGVRMIEQAEQNTQNAFAAMRAAAQASDLGEVMRIQSDYLREQGSRSVAQAREIGELIMRFGRDAVSPTDNRDG